MQGCAERAADEARPVRFMVYFGLALLGWPTPLRPRQYERLCHLPHRSIRQHSSCDALAFFSLLSIFTPSFIIPFGQPPLPRPPPAARIHARALPSALSTRTAARETRQLQHIDPLPPAAPSTSAALPLALSPQTPP